MREKQLVKIEKRGKEKLVIFAGVLLAWGLASVTAQPATAPLTPNTPCASSAGSATDTVVSTPDDSGYYSIFDGKDFKGWWESCQTAHSPEDRVNGGVWLVDTTYHAITSQQNPNGAGSVIMTNKKYTNYEMMLDYWSDFGDDGGVFNRTGATGDCYQTTLDYIQASSVGGSYGENGYGNFNIDPYIFNSPTDPTIIANTTQWTSITAKNNPTSYGCPASGCTASNWTTVWDTGGWMQIKFKFYGTGASASDKVHMQSWFRKYGTTPWVPVLNDSQQINTPAGYIGLQIHHTPGRWSGPKGAWYRNILVRPLDGQGNPINIPTVVAPGVKNNYKISATANALMGTVESPYEITITDLSGRVLDRFAGPAGSFRYAFHTAYRGLMLVQIQTARGEDYLRVSRIF